MTGPCSTCSYFPRAAGLVPNPGGVVICLPLGWLTTANSRGCEFHTQYGGATTAQDAESAQGRRGAPPTNNAAPSR